MGRFRLDFAIPKGPLLLKDLRLSTRSTRDSKRKPNSMLFIQLTLRVVGRFIERTSAARRLDPASANISARDTKHLRPHSAIDLQRRKCNRMKRCDYSKILIPNNVMQMLDLFSCDPANRVIITVSN